MSTMDYNGLQWITMDCNGLQWIAMVINGVASFKESFWRQPQIHAYKCKNMCIDEVIDVSKDA